jgi:hypothetical protein
VVSIGRVADDPEVIASTEDPHGREVVVLARIWTAKVLRDHPEMAPYLDDVVATVERPDHVSTDPRDDRLRYYRRRVGPSRWLLAVVSYEQVPARVITALALRKDPPSWSP